MQIVKKFDLEMAHIVRNAWSERCSKSIHGHTYTIEVVLERKDDSALFDAGRMVIDFGLVKKHIGPFIDAFDHSTLLWTKDEDQELVNFISSHSGRVIRCEESSSCEMMSAVLLVGINRLLGQCAETRDVNCVKVTVHETKTGRAECGWDSRWIDYVEDMAIVEQIWFSKDITDDWSNEFKQLAIAAKIGTSVML